MKQLLLILSLLLLSFTTIAQGNYPIYVTPTLTPPYSLKLSDYSAIGSQNLIVSVMVSDLNIVDLPVKLRIKMETVGITIENPPTITTTPIYLNGGVNTILFGEDLEDYFNINNLIFKGYGKDAYRKTGQLPGGFYKFSVEVLHFNTNRLISNTGSATAWIVLGKPPVLKSPADNEEVGEFIGMPITFSWLQSNVGSPVAKGNIQYKFEMWEMRVPGVHPNTVVVSIPVFHEYSTFNSLYSLYPSTLLMEPGMRYAWRVTATDISGTVPFEQNGHSEVRTFIYKAKCEDVSNVKGSAKGKNGTFTWDANNKHTSFNIEVREPESGWMLNSETYDTKASYFDLEPGETYQIRVQGVCNGDPQQISDFSDWESLTIPKAKPLVNTDECPNCGCDDEVPDVELSNLELKPVVPGDTIVNKTGTTRFIVRTVEDQGSNSYKGVFLFWAEIWGAKIICNYENLQVNTDNVIVNMDFESVYDPQYLIDVDAVSDFVNELADDVAILTTGTIVKDSLKLNTEFDQVIVRNDSVIAVKVELNGSFKEKFVDKADNLDKTLIKDTKGEEVVINGKGQPMGRKEFESTGGNSRLLKDYNKKKEDAAADKSAMISFSGSEQQGYGFDAYTPLKQKIQQYYPALNNGYRAAFKSLPAFGTDNVKPESQQGLTFKDQMGIKAMNQGDDLVLRGSFGGAEVPLYAYCMLPDSTEQVVGKLQMLSYTPQSKKLYIVKVNGGNMPTASNLQTALNKVYAQALTSWQVQDLELNLLVNFPGGKMTHGGSGAFTTYNSDQKTILEAFEQSGKTFERDAFYLFFIDGVQQKEKSIAGYMPLQRQAGFIYDNPDLNIVAHELAHGAFNLYHTFSEHQNIAKEGETENLMDYKGGTELWKHQWDLIHEPQNIVFAWGQDEKEGQAFGEKGTNYVCIKDKDALERISKYKKFYLADGRIVDLSGKAIASGFFTNLDQTEGAPGSLAAISIDEKDNLHLFSGNDSRGFGYTISSKSAVLSYSTQELIATDNSDAVSVFVDAAKKMITINKGAEKLEQFSYVDDCTCITPDPSIEVYFSFNKNTSHYVDFALKNTIKIQHQLHEDEELINSTLAVVKSKLSTNNKDEAFLGEILADKLKTYEIYNDRKFIVAPIKVNLLSLNQDSWNSLADKVFLKAGLGEKDILITIPYTQCAGIGRDLGEYYFMPGLAFGSDIKVDFGQLKTDYGNTQRLANFEAGLINPVESFIVDIFRHTSKKMLLYKAVYNASNTIECALVEKENVSGQAFNKTIRLYKQTAVDELAKIVADQTAEIQSRRDELRDLNYNNLNAAQIRVAQVAIEKRIDEAKIRHAEERLKFIEENATSSQVIPYQANYYNLKIREEFLDVDFDFEFDTKKELNLKHTFALAYIYTDAFNEIREKIKYDEKDLYNSWSSHWSFNSKTDYILQQYDGAIYNSLDGASLVLGCFGLDFITDGLGLGYSVLRGDVVNSSSYGISLMVVGPQGVAVSKATMSGLVILFTKNGIETVEETVGKKVLLKLAGNYANEGKISKELLNTLQNKEEKEIAALLQSAIKGNIFGSLTKINKLSSKTKDLIAKWDNDLILLFEKELSGYSDDLLTKLDADMLHKTWGSELTDAFMANPDDVTKFWKRVKTDPGECWDVSKTDPSWEKWSKREFFKNATAAGKKFEQEVVSNALKARNANARYRELKKKLGKNLDEYDMYEQVQLSFDEVTLPSDRKIDYFTADQVFIKWGKSADGFDDVIVDIVIIENKLTKATKLTPNQNAGKAASSLTVRSKERLVKSQNGDKLDVPNLLKGRIINIKADWAKIYDSSTGDVITDIIKL